MFKIKQNLQRILDMMDSQVYIVVDEKHLTQFPLVIGILTEGFVLGIVSLR